MSHNEYKCPYCGHDSFNDFRADGLVTCFCDIDDNGCGASGPFKPTKQEALEAFCNPTALVAACERINELETTIRSVANPGSLSQAWDRIRELEAQLANHNGTE